ncbi:hypothetical protein ACQY0O_000298 [Thecaphora frezii]
MSGPVTPTLLSSPEFDQGSPQRMASRGDMTSRLRRKRSLASAALTSRPSLLTLGRLTPSLETCVLIHTTSKLASPADGSHGDERVQRQLVHALFEPNFYVDGVKRRVEKLDRAKWERIRASVEDLRIVGLASREKRIHPNAPPLASVSNPGGLITPDASPRRKESGHDSDAARAPDCLFDLTSPSPTTDATKTTTSDRLDARSISTLLIQPRPYTAIPASRADELIEFEIRGVGDGILEAHRWSILPDQVKRILEEADLLSQPSEDDLLQSMQDTTLRDSAKTYGQEECRQICDQILQLVAPRSSSLATS